MGKKRWHKGTAELICYAESLGFVLIPTSNGHVKMQHSGNGAIMVFPSTPRVSNSELTKADLRRFAKHGRATGSSGK